MAGTTIADLTNGTTKNATDRIPVARSPFGAGDNRYLAASLFETAGTAAAAVTTHEDDIDPHPDYTTAAELAAYAQPLDSDLTSIAALSTTAFGRAFLALADAAATLTALGIASSAAELNFTDGVTSAIQTQLNAKAASLGADDNYVTDAEKVVIGNTSGINTGDVAGVEGWTFDVDVSGTADAAIAFAVNTLYVRNIAGYTADRIGTLPAVAAVGDRVGVVIQTGDSAFELLITATAGDTLNTIAGGTEWSRLFITGEVIIMRCVVANTTWVVEVDGRIPLKAVIYLTTNADGETAATYTYPTAVSGVWTASTDNASLTDVATDKITFRRAGKFMVIMTGLMKDAPADQETFYMFWEKNGTTLQHGTALNSSGTFNVAAVASGLFTYVADDYLRYKWQSLSGGLGLLADADLHYTSLHVCEVLP